MKKLCLLLISILVIFGGSVYAETLSEKDQINVVYLGGSITAGSGATKPEKSWVAQVGKYLEEEFKDSRVVHVNAGIGGTGSDYGYLRLYDDVISKNPDLVFVEFAVNDRWRTRDEAVTNMEAIVRGLQTMEEPPCVIFIYTTMQGNPSSAKEKHQEVADYYGIPTIDVGAVIEAKINSGTPVNELLGDGTHPTDAGYQIYTDEIIKKLKTGNYYKVPLKKQEKLLSPGIEENLPRAVSLEGLNYSNEWEKDGNKLKTTTPGANATYKFSGKAVGIRGYYSLAGGMMDVEIDGVSYGRWDTYNPFGALTAYHIIRGFPDGEHTLKITALSEKNEKSTGYELSIFGFYLMDEEFSETNEIDKLSLKNTMVKTESGQIRTNLKKGEINYFEATFTNTAIIDIDASAVMMFFDKNKTLLGCTTTLPKEFLAREENTFKEDIFIPNGDGVYMKLLLWENGENSKRIYDVKIFNAK